MKCYLTYTTYPVMLCTYGQAQLLSAFCNDFHIVLLIGSMKKTTILSNI